MRNIKSGYTGLVIFLLWFGGCKQDSKEPGSFRRQIISPDKLYGELFHEVQMQQVFPDSKTFADCVPRRSQEAILKEYKKRKARGFDLKAFVTANFMLPQTAAVRMPAAEKDIRSYIEESWPALLRKPDSVKLGGSLLPLPFPYIVSSSQSREVYYWESYFTMLGLQVSGRVDIMENMVHNFAYLIKTYGYIPKANRSYCLGRSQPPFFSLVVDLLARAKKDSGVYRNYLVAMEKEYMYWMDSDEGMKRGENSKKVIYTDDDLFLNRYLDAQSGPRPEKYREDVLACEAFESAYRDTLTLEPPRAADSIVKRRKGSFYRHLRAASESGWDNSSRWLANPGSLYSIQAARIAPVDLNCLLYFTEKLLGEQFALAGDTLKANAYQRWANERSEAIIKYFFNENLGFFTDYIIGDRKQKDNITAAGLFPLCFLDPNLLAGKMDRIETVVRKNLLAPGGLLTTEIVSGLQWDAPYGFAPLQWMAIIGLERCGKKELAREIATRWIRLNTEVFARTGTLFEKYNVADTKASPGGEYAGQAGFGWTNGVLLALIEKYGGPGNE